MIRNRLQESRLDSIIQAAADYSCSTGIPLLLINNKGNLLYQTREKWCALCQETVCETRLNCRNSFLYGVYQAERFGGKYIFFCKLGLTHWVSPVILDDNDKGALIAGPVLMTSPEEYLLEDIMLQNMSPGEVGNLKKHIGLIPVIEPDRVDSLSNLLFMVCAHVSGSSYEGCFRSREIMEQQMDISKYIHYLKTMGGETDESWTYSFEKEKELLYLISTGDKNGAQRVLNEILGIVLLKSGNNLEIVKARVLELIVVLSRAALEGGADVEQIFGLNYGYLKEIHDFRTTEELTLWLSKIMDRFIECVFDMKDVKHADVIYKAIDYIKKNYMKKITLGDVAAAVYLSPSYFSRVFKEATGQNFISYLNDYRIQVAKKLLLDDSIDLVDISNIVGYEDQSYFSKSFKKVTGMSPGRYRECRGQIQNMNAKINGGTKNEQYY